MNTAQLKQARLNAIQDEVKQLHPLLKLLLPKMKRVQQVEYTHGQHEMGADFVVSRLNDDFHDVEYIGIIAKIGKIVQDYTDVERQIKECEIERIFGNGRKKIYLNEVWVIATGQISHGAQEKIHAEYKSRKIVFIDGDRLSGLINDLLPNFWTDVSLQIGDYLHGVWTANDRLDKSLSLITNQTERFYIDQDVFESEEFDRKKRKPRKKADIHEQIDRNSVVLIEGGMGAGKSKLLRNLVDYYSTPHQFIKCNLLPLAVSFKEFIDKYESNPEKVVEALVPLELRNVKSEETKYLLLMDGADEKNLATDKLAEAVVNAAKSIDAAKMKAVITSRWCDGYERNSSLRNTAKRLELSALSTNRLIEFIKRLCRDIDLKSRLIEDLKKSSLFKELPKSPIAAILLAQLLNENAKELPSNLTELYAKYTELSLGRWDVDKGLQTQKEFEALSSIIIQLAEHFLTNSLEEISIGDAKEYFASYLKKRNLGLSANDLFNRLIERSDIVSVDDSKGVFRFKHKTFIEFFYAKAHLKKHIVIDERVWNPYWITSYYFYVGLQKDCPDLLQEIFNIKPKNETERWMRMTNIPNYLLAGFSSPYEVTEQAVAKAMQEAADLYTDISENVISSPFSIFPKMHFLWMVQMMIRRNYSFEFFRKAIELATVQISEECCDRKKCAISIFFLSVISRELDEKACFEFLVKNYQKDLPLEVELGIRHETDDDKKRSHLVKKLDQRMTRAINDNPSLKHLVTSLYEIPIRSKSKIENGK